MLTLKELKIEKMKALKAHDENKGNVLGVLIAAFQLAEIEKKAAGKEMEEADVLKILNHTLKELSDERAMYLSGNKEEEVQNCDAQIAVVKSYLPELMSEDEISKVIESLPDKSIKSIMVAFKKDYNGKADMALVNKIAREYQGK